MYDRVAVKQAAKAKLFSTRPAAWLVCLIFILATTWVVEIANLILPSPIAEAETIAAEWYTEAAQDPTLLEDAQMMAVSRQILKCFTGTQAAVALFVAVLLMLYSLVVTYGYYSYNMKTIRGEKTGIGELFSNFWLVGKIILAELLMLIFVYLWSMLFIIPGLIASYRYRMTPYILMDNPDISPLEAIRRSKAMMHGRKKDLFALELSFVGWMLLQIIVVSVFSEVLWFVIWDGTVLNLVILAINTVTAMFLTAYQQLSYAGFYEAMLHRGAPPVNEPIDFDSFRGPDEDSRPPRDQDLWNL